MEPLLPKNRLTIDGHAVTVEAGTTILEAARAAGVYIPSLCHHTALACGRQLTGAPFVYRGGERVESDDPAAAWDGAIRHN